MPTKKPRVQALLTPEEYKKFQALCKIKDRTESKLAGIMISKYITDYEATHGEIQVEQNSRGGGLS